MKSYNPPNWLLQFEKTQPIEFMDMVATAPFAPHIVKLDLSLIDENNRAMLIRTPDIALIHLREYLRESNPQHHDTITQNLEVRPINSMNLVPIRDIRADNMNTLIDIEGTIISTSNIHPRLAIARLYCIRCGQPHDVQQGDQYTTPIYCENPDCGRKGPFRLSTNESKFINVQTIKIQEAFEDVDGHNKPATLYVEATQELAGKAELGKKMRLTGVIKGIQKELNRQKQIDYDLKMVLTGMKNTSFDDMIVLSDDDILMLEKLKGPDIIDKLISSFAPSIIGESIIKEAMLVSAVSKGFQYRKDGTIQRDVSHLLLCGDPGIAKSALKHGLQKILPSIQTASGTGSKKVGLTAAAVKDELNGGFMLEAGVLPRADGSGAVIDEFDKLDPEILREFNDALSDCLFEVDKGGIHAKLRTRGFLIAILNPKKGRFNSHDPLKEQLEIEESTLSRFDLIFVLRDIPNAENDAKVGRRMLDARYNEDELVDNTEIPIDIVQKYITYARTFNPIANQDIQNMMLELFIKTRSQSRDGRVAVSRRFMEAIIRIAKAEAQLALSDTIDEHHLTRAMNLMSKSLYETSTDEDGNLDMDLLACGVGHIQRELVKKLRTIISSYKDWGGAQYGDIVLDMHTHQVTKARLDKYLERMMQDGTILKKSDNTYWCIR